MRRQLTTRPPIRVYAGRDGVTDAMVDPPDVSATVIDDSGMHLDGHSGGSLKGKVLANEPIAHHRDVYFSQIDDQRILTTDEWKQVVIGDAL